MNEDVDFFRVRESHKLDECLQSFFLWMVKGRPSRQHQEKPKLDQMVVVLENFLEAIMERDEECMGYLY